MTAGGAAAGAPAAATVLLVEDNALVRETLAAMLGALGYRVLATGEGRAARELLEGAEPIDVLFTDLVLASPPDGAELARIARALRPSIGILITSGLPGESIADPVGLRRRDGFLMKPYDFDELREALSRLLARG